MNTRSSTTAELVAADNVATMILWTKLFLEEQGYKVDSNILYQDNKSTILLEKNGKQSSSQRTRALNICYFFITNQSKRGNVEIEYCPTKNNGDRLHDKTVAGCTIQEIQERNNGQTDCFALNTMYTMRQECVGIQENNMHD